ncbi:hypothetical protein JG688_00010379 [Phytophthora aleatoria]|uniref:Uncharacterized protein n=1 Tax=Phytophthora aleatoria TaxID=2496075 RepID=A0A8J5IM95_9STRA|nr:hypothetical protein JG688_00010379 [Phytophthora aleatoria]
MDHGITAISSLVADLNCIRCGGDGAVVLYPKCVAVASGIDLHRAADRDHLQGHIGPKQLGKKAPLTSSNGSMLLLVIAQRWDQMRCEYRTRAVSSPAQGSPPRPARVTGSRSATRTRAALKPAASALVLQIEWAHLKFKLNPAVVARKRLQSRALRGFPGDLRAAMQRAYSDESRRQHQLCALGHRALIFRGA